jgi:hypothetical protein
VVAATDEAISDRKQQQQENHTMDTTKLTAASVAAELRPAVDAVLMTMALAELMREKVDAIQRAILTECPLTPGELAKKMGETAPITEPKAVYLCDDAAQLEDYYAECDKRERAAGLKPADMDKEFCPALVAESVQNDAELLMLDTFAELIKFEGGGKLFRRRLLCRGLDEFKRAKDLCIKIVVNMPGYQNPLSRLAM